MQSKVPHKIQKWIDDNKDKVVDYWVEKDGYSENSNSPYSIWLYLKPGWISDGMMCHLIHEPTVELFFDMVNYGISPCNCEQCQAELNRS